MEYSLQKFYHKVSRLYKSLLQSQLELTHQQAGLICLFKKALQKVDAWNRKMYFGLWFYTGEVLYLISHLCLGTHRCLINGYTFQFLNKVFMFGTLCTNGRSLCQKSPTFSTFLPRDTRESKLYRSSSRLQKKVWV